MIRRRPKYTGPERRKRKRWRPKPIRVLVSLVTVVAIGYMVAVVWLVGEETTTVLKAGRTLSANRPPFPYEQIDLPRADGQRQFAWVIPRDPTDRGSWVIFLHGNASNIASSVNISHYRTLRSVGLNVLAPEYRGFAGLEGLPTEGALDADARAAYDYLRTIRHIDPGRIVIYGWSLGAAVGVDLASHVELAAFILEGAPSSQIAISQRRYPFFPMRLLMRNRFDSIAKIGRVQTPMLFLHSPEDVVVPIEEGRRLFAAARGDKTFVEVRGGHFDATDVDPQGFSKAIRAFLQRYGVPIPNP